jgi:hypothetical protein
MGASPACLGVDEVKEPLECRPDRASRCLEIRDTYLDRADPAGKLVLSLSEPEAQGF